MLALGNEFTNSSFILDWRTANNIFWILPWEDEEFELDIPLNFNVSNRIETFYFPKFKFYQVIHMCMDLTQNILFWNFKLYLFMILWKICKWSVYFAPIIKCILWQLKEFSLLLGKYESRMAFFCSRVYLQNTSGHSFWVKFWM